VLLAAVLAARGAACRGKNVAPAAGKGKKATIAAPHWVTPLMTQPPPRPTVTMWVGVTRAPQLPE
jgi:hypothetical protein